MGVPGDDGTGRISPCEIPVTIQITSMVPAFDLSHAEADYNRPSLAPGLWPTSKISFSRVCLSLSLSRKRGRKDKRKEQRAEIIRSLLENLISNPSNVRLLYRPSARASFRMGGKKFLINQFLRQTFSRTKEERNPRTGRYRISRSLESSSRRNHLFRSDPTVGGLILICCRPSRRTNFFN